MGLAGIGRTKGTGLPSWVLGALRPGRMRMERSAKCITNIVRSIGGIHPRSMTMLTALLSSTISNEPQYISFKGNVSVLDKNVFTLSDLAGIRAAIKETPTFRHIIGIDKVASISNPVVDSPKVEEIDARDIWTDNSSDHFYTSDLVHHLIFGYKVGLIQTRARGTYGRDDGSGEGTLFLTSGILHFNYHYDESICDGSDNFYSISFYVPTKKGANPESLPNLVKEVFPGGIFKKAFSLEYKPEQMEY